MAEPTKKTPTTWDDAVTRCYRATDMLIAGIPPAKVVQQLVQIYDISERVAWRDLKRSRDALAASKNHTWHHYLPTAIAQAEALYHLVLKEKKFSIALSALKWVAELNGHCPAPLMAVQNNVTITGGKNPALMSDDEIKQQLKQLRERRESEEVPDEQGVIGGEAWEGPGAEDDQQGDADADPERGDDPEVQTGGGVEGGD